MSEHVMLDLETMGKGNDAAILSIGAAKFDPFGEGVTDSFYVQVDLASSQQAGLKIDASTIMWWMDEKRAEARTAMMGENRVDLSSALWGFIEWFGEDKPVWGNGATFDNVIISSALQAVNLEKPWQFWNDRCYRTLKNLAPSVKLERIGTYHNARDDAISQALHMQKVVKHLCLTVV